MKQQVLQTEFRYTYDGIIYKLYNMWNRSSKREKTYNYTSFYQSAFTWPVRLVLPTGQTGRHYPEASTGQTSLRKIEGPHTQPCSVQPNNFLA